MKAGRVAVVDGAAALAGMTVQADRAAAGESPYRMCRTGTHQFMRTFLTFTGGSEEPRGRSALSVTPAVCFRGDPRLTDYGKFRSFPDERDGPGGSGLSEGPDSSAYPDARNEPSAAARADLLRARMLPSPARAASTNSSQGVVAADEQAVAITGPARRHRGHGVILANSGSAAAIRRSRRG